MLGDQDCVVFTGDIFDADKRDQFPAVELIMAVNKLPCRKFLIWGNHEKGREGFEEFERIVSSTGIEIIGGKTVVLGDMLISGLDYSQEQYGVNIGDLPDRHFRNRLTREILTTEQEIKHRILIAHSFKQTKEACELGNYTLALCGHEHGGQVRLPLLGAILPAQAISLKAVFPELRGHFTKGNHLIGGTYVHICSGCGSSLVPVRFLNRAQISVIDIN